MNAYIFSMERRKTIQLDEYESTILYNMAQRGFPLNISFDRCKYPVFSLDKLIPEILANFDKNPQYKTRPTVIEGLPVVIRYGPNGTQINYEKMIEDAVKRGIVNETGFILANARNLFYGFGVTKGREPLEEAVNTLRPSIDPHPGCHILTPKEYGLTKSIDLYKPEDVALIIEWHVRGGYPPGSFERQFRRY